MRPANLGDNLEVNTLTQEFHEDRGLTAVQPLRDACDEFSSKMMDALGGLFLARQQMVREDLNPDGLSGLIRRFEEIATDLRASLLQSRLQPLSLLFSRLPDAARDLALCCEKKIRLELSGEETGVDRRVLETMEEAISAALRNAIEHGIEAPQERLAAGKPERGTIRLAARHQSGFAVVELWDDGAGVQSPEWLAGINHIRRQLSRFGGVADVQTREGVGAVLRLRVPLAIEFTPGLIVEAAGERFCILQDGLAEVSYLRQTQTPEIPVVSLGTLLQLEDAASDDSRGGDYVASFTLEGQHFGVAVEGLPVCEQIVVQPLPHWFQDEGFYVGATSLGDDGILPVLDARTLLARLRALEAAQSAYAEELQKVA
jgi:two-component system chemotaxis sensor kinase CheA